MTSSFWCNKNGVIFSKQGNGKNALYTLWTGAEVGDLYRKRIVDQNGPTVKNEPVLFVCRSPTLALVQSVYNAVLPFWENIILMRAQNAIKIRTVKHLVQ